MNDDQVSGIISQFLTDFNRMCRTQQRSFLIRERIVAFETGPTVFRVPVTYRVKRHQQRWQIFARNRWFFWQKYPLLEIIREHDSIRLEGLYTGNFQSFPVSQLSSQLQVYLHYCQNLPPDAFTRK